MMTPVLPPDRPSRWRPDRPTTLILVGIAFGIGALGLIQARSDARFNQLLADGARERADLGRRLDTLQGLLGRLDKTVPGADHATAAAESGRRALREGRWDAGQLFLINAITNDARNVDHLKTYTAATLAHDHPPREALDQLASILQMAACHVAPDDVSTVIGLIDRVAKARNRPEPGEPTSTPPTDAASTDSLAAEWADLKAPQEGLHRDPVRLADHLRKLDSFAATLDERGNASEELTREVADQILRWTEIAQAAKNAAYVAECLAKLTDDKLEHSSPDRAVAIVQAAEAVLPSFWGIRAGTLPDDLRKRVDGFPELIKERVAKIGARRSAELIADIDKALKKAVATPPGTAELQRQCLEFEEQIREAQVLAAQLPSPDKILEAQGRIKVRSDELQKRRSEQYSLYQADVIRRCQEAFKVYNEYKLPVPETNAFNIIHRTGLVEVDQSLLTPEVARLFNDVIGKLMARLGPENLVEIEHDMGKGTKRKLEDF